MRNVIIVIIIVLSRYHHYISFFSQGRGKRGKAEQATELSSTGLPVQGQLSLWFVYLMNIQLPFSISRTILVTTSQFRYKHCQRHNGPEGWVHLTSSYTNLDQISISESRLQLQNLNQTSGSRLNFNLKSRPNLASESLPRLNFVTLRGYNLNQTSAAKYWLNFNFKILLQL